MKKFYLAITIIVVMLFITTKYVQAIDNTFQVSTSITQEDLLPPSIPNGVISTPISSSEINIVWNASTDDVAVMGYRIFRDGIIIATTSSLLYTDFGLAPSTPYSYTVEAFDGVYHYSGQSAVTTSTTFAESIVPTTTPVSNNITSSSGSRLLMINDLKVDSSTDSATMTFTTTHPAQVKVFWGTTINYEQGSISGSFYGFDHSIKIPSLNPDTKYYFRIEAVNRMGFTVYLEGFFQSQKVYNFLSLSNVTHFQAIPQDNSIALLWDIPKNRDIDSVRIVRSDKFFPRDINDGEIIFEGYSESYQDVSVIKNKTYYYAIFAKNSRGEYSSGVLAQAKISERGSILVSPTSTDPFINIPIIENLDSVIRDLMFSDFDFIQDNKKIENTNSIVTVDGLKNLTVILGYEKVPEILKTIAVTLTDPKDQTKVFTFLLRVNKEKTLYEATIAPLGESGRYKMNIIVLDYKNQGLKRIEGLLNVMIWENINKIFKSCGVFSKFSDCVDFDARNKIWTFIILIILLIIAILGFVFRNRKNKKESKVIHEQ